MILKGFLKLTAWFQNILIESFVNFVLIPNLFNNLDPSLSLGLSFLFNSPKFLKFEIPFAFAATKNITRNSSIAALFIFFGQLIAFISLELFTKISAVSSPL